jgi:hypothetical protein
MGVGSWCTAPNPDPSLERNSRFTETGPLVSWKRAPWFRACSFPFSFRTNRDFPPMAKLAFPSLFAVCSHFAHLESTLAECPLLMAAPLWLHHFEVS